MSFTPKGGMGRLNMDQIYGRVCTLFRIKEPEKYAVALQEVIGGGRLRSVVVESAEVARQLIECESEERITILPLQQIQAHKMEEEHVEKVRQVS